MERGHLDARLSDGTPVPNTWLRHSANSDSLALMLPGRGYTALGPVLRYPLLWLLEHGIDVATVDYSFDNLPSGTDAGTHAYDCACAVLNAVQKAHGYTRLILIGKSLGTPAMARLMTERDDVQPEACIWLTPILSSHNVKAAVQQRTPRSLFVIGTADALYDESGLRTMVDASNGQSLVVKNANHSLEIDGDVRASVAVIARLLDAIESCLSNN